MKRTQKSTREETVFVNSKGDGDAAELNNLVAASPLEVRLISLYSFFLFEQWCEMVLCVHCMCFICRKVEKLIGLRQKICLRQEIGEKWN